MKSIFEINGVVLQTPHYLSTIVHLLFPLIVLLILVKTLKCCKAYENGPSTKAGLILSIVFWQQIARLHVTMQPMLQVVHKTHMYLMFELKLINSCIIESNCIELFVFNFAVLKVQ